MKLMELKGRLLNKGFECLKFGYFNREKQSFYSN